MNYEFEVDLPQLIQQIKAVLESDMPEPEKTGLHNLLGEIRDQTEDKD